jgi:competence protein ComEA
MLRVLAALSLAVLVAVQGHAQTGTPQKANSRTTQSKAPVMVNLNTATAEELEQLPGVGAKTAARIVDYRQKKGPFKKPEELMNVQGIGEKSFLKLKSQITVSSKPESAQSQQNQ